MRRVFFCFVWAIVLFCLFAVAISLMTTAGAKNDQERERVAKQVGEKYALLLLVGPIGLSIALSVAGVLPGTRRPKQTEPAAVAAPSSEAVGAMEPSHFNTAHPSARSVLARPAQQKSPSLIEGSSEHPFTFAGFWDRWSLTGQGAIFFGGLGLFFMAAGSRSAQQQVVVLVGGGFAAMGLVMLLFFLYRMGMLLEVRLSSEGITWSGMLGSRHRTWEEVANVYRAETLFNRRYRTRDLRLEFSNGGAVTINQSIADFDALADHVQKATGALILPRKRAELSQGKAAFGPVTLTPDGIQMTSGVATNFFAWDNLACYTIVNGHLVLQARSRLKRDVFAAIVNALFVDHQRYKRLGGDMAVPLAKVPNYLVLLALMGECGAAQG